MNEFLFFQIFEPTMPSYRKQANGAFCLEEIKDNNEVEEYDEDVDASDTKDLSSVESSNTSQVDIQVCSSSPQNEKQISVDPMSLKQLIKTEDCLSLAPAPSTGPQMHTLPPLIKPKYISISLPCSATSSPQYSSSTLPKNINRWRLPAQKPHPVLSSLARQQSAAAMSQPHLLLQRQGMHLRRSKSCGEGRTFAPSDEFDILPRPSFQQPENGVHVIYECHDNIRNSTEPEESSSTRHDADEGFKCGALCLFLPGLSKKKQVNSNQDEQEVQGGTSPWTSLDKGGRLSRVVSLEKISRVASLEKFECGSWSESAILDAEDDDDGLGAHSYFDLPLELIKSCSNDAESPVNTAFIFERDRKGVLKKCTSRLTPRKSHESSNRHVRFSTSAPTSYPPSPSSSCITPRLWKAREEFNALLEAQGS